MYRPTALVLGVLLVLSPLGTQSTYAQVPTFEDVAGHAFGERITQHHEMRRYLEALAGTSDRVTVVDQGASWEGRRLLVAIVTSPANHARLDEIQRNAQRLADPRLLSPEEAQTLAGNQPAVLWYGGSIHGFELSGSEGVLMLLERLASATDAATLSVLDNTVILIDPVLNPDGRDAFAHLNHENIGSRPTANRDDWSNDFTTWQALKFRSGHYYFDTNRDWFAHTQRETQARMPTIQAWRPQFMIDMHEQGPDVEFYFDPADNPYGPFFPQYARRGFDDINRSYVSAFDSAGIRYMTGERYNYFYPGYTTSQGSYQGAVGMLYEQGSSRGLALTRPDGSVRTLLEASTNQYLAAWTAAKHAADNRQQLLLDYYAQHEEALAEGQTGFRRYLVESNGDHNLHRELADLLTRGGVEVNVLTQEATLSGVRDRAGNDVGRRTFGAGTLVIEASQPRNRLVRVLLEPHVQISEDFLAEARHRVDRAENPRFYDITAWSLPLLFNLNGFSATDDAALTVRRYDLNLSPQEPAVNPGRAGYAYLIGGEQAATVSVGYHLVHRGYRAGLLIRETSVEGQRVERGTVVVRVGQNDDSVHDTVRELVERFEVTVRAVSTGRADVGRGPSLGSADVRAIQKPSIAILAEDPVSPLSFGFAWYTLDQQYQIPTTVIRAGSLAGTPLDDYNVLIVPAVFGNLGQTIGEGGMDRVRRFVREGGTLVTIASATAFAGEGGLGLIGLGNWYDGEGDGERAYQVPGAIFNVELDPEYWLSSGLPEGGFPALVDGSRLFTAPEGPPSFARRAVGVYGGDDVLLSGHAWPESQERIPGKVFLYEQRVGAGRVIAFAEDPNYRAYFRGANRLFLNAVVLGPSGN